MTLFDTDHLTVLVNQRHSLHRQRRIRIGTQDLKIAAISRVHDALLLSTNVRDFGRVPGLRVESWID